MTDKGESGGGPERAGWQGRKSRDDTPSFIRDVQARAELLHPSRSAEEHIPVLTMPRSVRIWRRVRWPLFIGIVVVALGALALFTNDRLQARSVEKRISEAHASEALGTVQGLLEAGQILSVLAERHPDRANAQAAWAWHAVLLAELFGPAEHYLTRARAALDRVGPADPILARAARAGLKASSGDATGALEIVLDGLKQHAGDPRLLMARCLALKAAGRPDDAASALGDLRAAHPDYLPAHHLSLLVAIESGDRGAVRTLAEDLLGRSPGNLLGAMATVSAGLPEWGEDEPPAEAIARMRSDMNNLSGRIAEAPPRLLALGRFLQGRAALLSGHGDEAVAALSKAFADDPSASNLAWLALATHLNDGTESALRLLDGHADVTGPEVLDTRVRCLLEDYRVVEAREQLEQLKRSGALPGIAAELGWVLAVRSGDTDGAMESLPPRLGSRHWKPALELYEQLRSRGDLESIATLADAMTEALGPCAAAIRAWHEPGTEAALAALLPGEGASPCVDALAIRLLSGRVEPAGLRQAASRLSGAGGDDDRMLKVLRSRFVWLYEGQTAAGAVLDAVRESRADAQPLRLALAEAYIDVGLADRALTTLEGLADEPAGRALRLRALLALGRKGEIQALLDGWIKTGEESVHPALAVFDLERELELSAFDRVIEKADRTLPTAGRWTAEIAELKARALNIVGARGDADRALEAAFRDGRKAAGQGEGWDARLAQIRLNLRRGGAFLYKAQSIIVDLYRTGLRDAELSYSYGVTNIRQGNDRGAVRYLREAIDVDPSFVPAYSQLAALGKLGDDVRAGLERTRPGTPL